MTATRKKIKLNQKEGSLKVSTTLLYNERVAKLIILLILIFFFPKQTIASEDQFITLVNPVRISTYNLDPKASLGSQYEELSKRELSATWLLTYDALNLGGVIEAVKEMSSSNEIGIFLEVTESFCNAAGVTYNKTDSWHRANSVLTTGYSQKDRVKLIDAVFEKYKQIFDSYPTSVGAWWIDSFSLDYMKKKYGLTANLTVADQFSTDGYGVWGQYFSTPFYPSKFDAGMPASSIDNKLNIVTMQWAPRDPLNSLGISEESRYSTQDYQLLNLPDSYFQKLIMLYSQRHRNQFGHIVLGLESDLQPQNYQGLFARQMDLVKKLNSEGKAKIATMKEFSNWYREKFKDLSPPHVVETDDLLDKNMKVVWYQSPKYRIGLIIDRDADEIKIVDFRTYHPNFQEPYFAWPNKELELYIRNPAILDIVQNSHSFLIIPTGGEVTVEGSPINLSLNFPKGQLIFKPSSFEFNEVPRPIIFDQSKLVEKLKPKTNEYQIVLNWPYPKEGLIFKDLPAQFWYLTNSENFKKPQNIKRVAAISTSLTILIFFIWFSKIYRKKVFKRVLISMSLIGLIILLLSLESYHVSQSELDSLLQLKLQPEGKVIVLNRDCIRCSYLSRQRPAVFANRRDYIKKISGKDIIYNRSIFTAADRPTGKRELDKLKARYIYVVKYGDYKEIVPFSPGDYNLDLIYENANSQLWKIKTTY